MSCSMGVCHAWLRDIHTKIELGLRAVPLYYLKVPLNSKLGDWSVRNCVRGTGKKVY